MEAYFCTKFIVANDLCNKVEFRCAYVAIHLSVYLNFVLKQVDEGLYHAVNRNFSFILKQRNKIVKVEFSNKHISWPRFIVSESRLNQYFVKERRVCIFIPHHILKDSMGFSCS